MRIDTHTIDKLEIMVHADVEEFEKSPLELEEVENPHEGVAVMNHEDYDGPEITITLGELKASKFFQAIEEDGYQEVPQGVDEHPLCPKCMVQMDWNGSSICLAKCPECRHEYRVRRQVRTAVSKVENPLKDKGNETGDSGE